MLRAGDRDDLLCQQFFQFSARYANSIFGAYAFANRSGILGVGSIVPELLQFLRSALRSVALDRQAARDAKANSARSVVRLIEGEWHHQHPMSRAERLGGGSNPALMYVDSCAGNSSE